MHYDSSRYPNSTIQLNHSKNRLEAGRVFALRLDFVAKPECAANAAATIGELLSAADLYREGLQSSMVLVSDREARLVTLLTLWDAYEFAASRERRASWLQKLVAGCAEGPVRSSSGFAHFVQTPGDGPAPAESGGAFKERLSPRGVNLKSPEFASCIS